MDLLMGLFFENVFCCGVEFFFLKLDKFRISEFHFILLTINTYMNGLIEVYL